MAVCNQGALLLSTIPDTTMAILVADSAVPGFLLRPNTNYGTEHAGPYSERRRVFLSDHRS